MFYLLTYVHVRRPEGKDLSCHAEGPDHEITMTLEITRDLYLILAAKRNQSSDLSKGHT